MRLEHKAPSSNVKFGERLAQGVSSACVRAASSQKTGALSHQRRVDGQCPDVSPTPTRIPNASVGACHGMLGSPSIPMVTLGSICRDCKCSSLVWVLESKDGVLSLSVRTCHVWRGTVRWPSLSGCEMAFPAPGTCRSRLLPAP